MTLRREPAGLALTIRDDGHGAHSAEEASRAGKSSGFGKLGMEERVLALGGTLQIGPAPDRGMLVSVHLPLPSTEIPSIKEPQ